MWYKNGTVFNSQQAIRLDNPNTSLPSFMSDEFIESFGYTQVMDTPNPATTLQNSYQDGVEVVNGVPMVKWKVVDKTEEELSAEAKIFTDESYIEAEEAREETLSYLASTDWYIIRFADSGVEIPQEVKDKRAEARLKL